MLIAQDTGDYFDDNGVIKRNLGLNYTKCQSWRLDPLVKAPKPIEDPNLNLSHSQGNLLMNKTSAEADAQEFFNKNNNNEGGSIDLKQATSNQSKPLIEESKDSDHRKQSQHSIGGNLK